MKQSEIKSLRQIIFKTDHSYNAFVIRTLLSVVLFAHGAQKLLGWFEGHGFSGTMAYFTESVGLPWSVGFLVIFIEFFGLCSFFSALPPESGALL